MKIAFIGQKGIPATFGGVEQHVEELASRLAERGHDVSVYVRNWYTPPDQKTHRDVKLIHTPTVKTKHLDAFVHSLTSSLHSFSQRYDIIHYHAIGPGFFSWASRAAGRKTVVTIHRFDYEASKWGSGARLFLKACEKIALKAPNCTICVGKHQRKFYLEQGQNVAYIPNGVSLPESIAPGEIKTKFGLRGMDYVLFMGRLVPEKQVDMLIDAFLEASPGDIKLVVAGGSSETDVYVSDLHRRAARHPEVIFTDYVTGRLKSELFSNARLFVIPSALEGLPIALLEAMSYGLVCLASDIEPHGEIISDQRNGFLFRQGDRQDLTRAIVELASLDNRKSLNIRGAARRLVESEYDWNQVVDQIEETYYRLLRKE